MIDPERWRQIDALLVAALEREPAERLAFLKEASAGDDSLRMEVESLLASSEHALSLIDTPAFEVAAGLLATHIPELAEGELLGNYRTLSFLGAGGMGEVYLAEDRRLDRRVAIKLLPAGSNLNRKQLQRFQQEARAASALNHPNILTIHELGEVDGRQFIATEYVEGETLRQRMKRGRLELRNALDVAVQTASALAAAHHAGIVHRDVKPENIMLRPDGYVKVLDFGLAKLTQQYERTPAARAAAQVDTSSGLVMGTVKYMSPEQARGLPVDPRSDIFSLGVVLYEMLAGHTPFQGNETAGLIKSILKAEPTPLSQLAPELPIELEQIVSRALARNRADRYQTMGDLLAGLAQLKRRLDAEQTLSGGRNIESTVSEATTTLSSEFPTTNTTQSITQQVVSMVAEHKLQAGVTLLGVLVAAGGIFYSSARRWRKPPAFQEVQMTPLVETDRSQMSAISPDGRYIAHTITDGTGQSLLLRTVATNNNTVLVPSSGAWFYGVTFSRDGNYVYYVMAKEDVIELYRVPLAGGDSVKTLTNVASPITFSPDGKRFAFVRDTSKEETGLVVANADGTQERILGQRKSPNFFSPAGPSWSADGRLIACAVFDQQPDKQPSFMNVAGINVDDGTERLLTNGKWSKVLQVAWLSDNSGFIMAATQKGQGALLWYVSYPDGNYRRITNDPSNYPSDYNSVSLTADSTTLVASRFETRTNLWNSPSGDPGQIKQITFGGNHRFQRLAWTPDGKIVFPSDASGDRELWMMDGNGGNLKQLTADGRFNQLPTVSPDDRYIVYVSGSSAGRHIWRMNLDGSGALQLTNGKDEFGPQCSSDGRWVLYMSGDVGKISIWKIPIEGGEPHQFTKEISSWPVVSPDGALVSCWWWDSPNSAPKIAIIPFAGGAPVQFIDPLPGAAKDLPMRWTSNGEALIYCASRNDSSNVWSQPLDGSPPKQLTDFKSETIQGFDWSHDDRLLLARGFTAREIVLIQSVNH